MKKLIIILILSCGFLVSESQTLRINFWLRDSSIGSGQRALFFDTTRLGAWKNISQQAGGGGSGTPGGSNGQIQYNNAGAFGGTTTGTGVLTALGNNVGSAGSFVVFGGALGTPSSANLTNAIGYLGANLVLTDITANNVTTSAHGFFPKLTSNSVYYVNNSGALTALALGASGTVLTSNGATSAPTFTAPAAGGVTSVAAGFGTSFTTITSTGSVIVDSTSGGVTTYLQTMKKVDSLGALSAYRIVTTRNVTGGVNNYGAVTGGADNFAIGGNLFNTLTSGSRNISIGVNNARRVTTGDHYIAIGSDNFKNVNVSNLNSSPGIAIGLENNGYSKYKNLAIGSYNNGFNVDSADAVNAIMADNMSIGVENLINLRAGLDNMVFSWGGFESLDSGSFNVGIGQYTMGRLTAGHFNVAVGHGAGYRTTTGNGNIFLGDSSGYGAGPGTHMIGVTFLGSRTRYTGTNLYNRTAIGDSALVSQDNFIALGKTGTFVGVARATATESFHTDGAVLIGAAAATTDGTIQWTGSDFQGRKAGAWKSFTAPSIADLTGLTSNSVYYVNNSGVITALALGANGTVLTSNGATSAPTFTTPAGGGDVSKVGTPVNNQVGVWTGDGTLEGDANLTFASSTLNIGVAGAATGLLTLSGVTSGTITLQPASAAGTYTLTLPTNDGDASQVLTTNGSGVLTWETPSGGASWNAITNPTADQALTFDAGESSTWTDANTTEDLFTVNSSTGTTNSMFSLNRTGTALASGNNIMELVSSGANGTNAITATGLRISVTNTNGTSGTNTGIDVTASGATTDNIAINATGKINATANISSSAGDLMARSGTASETVFLGRDKSVNTFPGIWFGANASTATTDNFSFLYSTPGTVINGPGATGWIHFRNNNDFNNGVLFNASLRFGIGHAFNSTLDRKFEVRDINATTNAITILGRFSIESTGTPANGIGGGIEFEAETASGNLEIGASIEVPATDVTSTSEDFDMVFKTMTAGATATEAARLTSLKSLVLVGRSLEIQGADVASVAGAIALGTDGNAFEITGTNAITLISNLNWQNGAIITLAFTSTATLTDGTANSGTDIGMELAGNTNFVASAGATLTLRLLEIGGTQRWREVARSVQ